MNQIIKEVTQDQLIEGRDEFKVGDGVRVHTKVREGDKERIQVFHGIVIARKLTPTQLVPLPGRASSQGDTVFAQVSGLYLAQTPVFHSSLLLKLPCQRYLRLTTRLTSLHNLGNGIWEEVRTHPQKLVVGHTSQEASAEVFPTSMIGRNTPTEHPVRSPIMPPPKT